MNWGDILFLLLIFSWYVLFLGLLSHACLQNSALWNFAARHEPFSAVAIFICIGVGRCFFPLCARCQMDEAIDHVFFLLWQRLLRQRMLSRSVLQRSVLQIGLVAFTNRLPHLAFVYHSVYFLLTFFGFLFFLPFLLWFATVVTFTSINNWFVSNSPSLNCMSPYLLV